MDFGLARSLTDTDRGKVSEAAATQTDGVLRTETGARLGTPAYMSPEQHRGDVADPRSDQFSFCIALWEALDGRRPFAGETVGEVRRAVESGKRRPWTRRVPPEVRQALARGLAVDPADRFESMADLDAALAPRWSWKTWGGVLLASVAMAGGLGYLAKRDPALADPVVVVDSPHASVCNGPPPEAAEWESKLEHAFADLDQPRIRDEIVGQGRSYLAEMEAVRVETCAREDRAARHLECLAGTRSLLDAAMGLLDESHIVDVRRSIIWGLPNPRSCTGAEPEYPAFPRGEAETMEQAWRERAWANALFAWTKQRWPEPFPVVRNPSDPVAAAMHAAVELADRTTIAAGGNATLHDSERRDLEALRHRAEEIGAVHVALLTTQVLLRDVTGRNQIASPVGFELMASWKSRAERLHANFSLSGEAMNRAASARDPAAVGQHTERALALLAGSGRRNPRLAAIVAGAMGYWQLGAVDELNNLVDRMLADPMLAADGTSYERFTWFGEVDREILTRKQQRTRPQLTEAWRPLESLTYSTEEARAALAAGSSDPLERLAIIYLAIELGDLPVAARLLADAERDELQFLRWPKMRLAIERGDWQQAEELVDSDPRDFPMTGLSAGLVHAHFGRLEAARANLEAFVLWKMAFFTADLHMLSRGFFELAKVLHQLGPEHQPRAVRISRGVLDMYDRGAGSLFAPHRARVKAWLDEHAPEDPQ